MAGITVLVDAGEIGRVFAREGDTEQAVMLNALGKELWDSIHNKEGFETQIYFVSGGLDAFGRRLIKDLAVFIQLREQEELK